MSALSYALDLVEGQPEGHSVRACMLGMRLGRAMKLKSEDRSALFYALLMKDLGCSSNAAKMCFLFTADDMTTKGDFKTVNWRNLREKVAYAAKHVAPGSPFLVRIMRIIGMAAKGERTGKELIQIRCERGAQIARQFGLPEKTALAIHSLDEHYDGGGHPDGLIGEQIPLLARIMGLSQTAEVFLKQHGLESMRQMARDRRGTWFEPELVDHLLAIKDEDPLWEDMRSNLSENLKKYEEGEEVLIADDSRMDSIAHGFAQVIDAKSPWTFRHSLGVADIATGIGNVLQMPALELRNLKRAALLHDIGKLGVSNLILDKPGKLTPEELTEMRRHPEYTYRILQKVTGFSDLADMAASHHERLDGKGYHRGISGNQLTLETRILHVSDMYEALAAKRPYRQDLTDEQVMDILHKNCPSGICPMTLDALKTFLNQSKFVPYQVAA